MDVADALYPTGPSATLGNDPVGEENLSAADKEMKLSQQEKALYKRHLTNLVGSGGVDNPDGSRSTLFQMSVGLGDKVYNIPTVWNGKILPLDAALSLAKKEGIDKFPSYSSQEEAESRYEQMHIFMKKDTSKYLEYKKGR